MAKTDWKHYQTIHRLPEYQATLYTKHDSKRKVWQCRTKPRRGPAIIKSTKTTSFAEAVEFARRAFEAIKTAESAGLSPRMDPSFNAVWIHFRNHHIGTQRMSAGRMKTLTGIVEKYFLGFYGDISIREIKSANYESYKQWRREYWITGAGVKQLQANPNIRHAKIPAPSTLNYEHAGFMQVLHWAHKSGYIAGVPPLSGYTHKKGIPKTRGGGISSSQWARLVGELFKRAFNPVDKHGKPVQLNSAHKHERMVLYFIVVFIGGSMVRPSEAYRLRWRNIRWRSSTEKQDVEDLLIQVPAEVAKTKESRIAVGTNRCAEYMRRWFALTQFDSPDDFVFPRNGGQQLASVNQTFKKVCRELEITEDHENVPITFYSCRHFGITSALMRGIPILDVALYGGTSVHHIEKRYYRVDLERRSSVFALQEHFSPSQIKAGDD